MLWAVPGTAGAAHPQHKEPGGILDTAQPVVQVLSGFSLVNATQQVYCASKTSSRWKTLLSGFLYSAWWQYAVSTTTDRFFCIWNLLTFSSSSSYRCFSNMSASPRHHCRRHKAPDITFRWFYHWWHVEQWRKRLSTSPTQSLNTWKRGRIYRSTV